MKTNFYLNNGTTFLIGFILLANGHETEGIFSASCDLPENASLILPVLLLKRVLRIEPWGSRGLRPGVGENTSEVLINMEFVPQLCVGLFTEPGLACRAMGPHSPGRPVVQILVEAHAEVLVVDFLPPGAPHGRVLREAHAHLLGLGQPALPRVRVLARARTKEHMCAMHVW